MEETRFLSTAGQPLVLTISFGAAELDASIESPLQLLELASTQTLAARNVGPNRVYPLLLLTGHEAFLPCRQPRPPTTVDFSAVHWPDAEFCARAQ